jgi:D-lactate dehydrogenase
MKIAFYSAKPYEESFFNQFNINHFFMFFSEALNSHSIHKSAGCSAVCCFVTDCLKEEVIHQLAANNIRLIALRSAGFDHVDLEAAKKYSIPVVRVPNYSAESIAEFAVALILLLSRKILKAYVNGLKNDFSLDNLIGFNLHGKTVGIIGTGHIGTAFAKIMHGFGCKLLAIDPKPNEICRDLNVKYVSLEELLRNSDIISLHCLLNNETKYMMNKQTFDLMKDGAMLINTGRGGLCHTLDLIAALENGKLGYAGLDVYEKERGLFFIDHHGKKLEDKEFVKLKSLPNVIITPHQAYLTEEAMTNIAQITIKNIDAFQSGKIINQVC